MAYAELTTEQKDTLNVFINNTREIQGRVAQVLQQIRATRDFYAANSVQTILNALVTEDVVPNVTGIADASDLTKADIEELKDLMLAFLNDASTRTSGFDTVADRELRVKAAGIRANL